MFEFRLTAPLPAQPPITSSVTACEKGESYWNPWSVENSIECLKHSLESKGGSDYLGEKLGGGGGGNVIKGCRQERIWGRGGVMGPSPSPLFLSTTLYSLIKFIGLNLGLSFLSFQWLKQSSTTSCGHLRLLLVTIRGSKVSGFFRIRFDLLRVC